MTVIRPVAPGDLAQWEPLWEGYNLFYKRTVAPEITRVTWQRFFDSYEPIHAAVAERDGRLVGLVHYLYHRHSAMIGPACYLQDLFTEASTRGQGVGKGLIEYVFERAREAGSPRVYWSTQETNTVARGLYDKLAVFNGFIRYDKIL